MPVARPGALDWARPPGPSSGPLGARLRPGLGSAPRSGFQGSPTGCVGALAAAATRAGPPHRGPQPPPRPGPPRPAHPAARSRAVLGLLLPALASLLPSPRLCPQTRQDTRDQVQPRRKRAARNPGFEPEAH